ncbi:RsmE family RNA methyltransferase [Gracilimonas mengyeensis]|uniref:Ribosomal RNA small subunit methyltransferase E n=1 Tax=Gracilimonas mengyeensis TaxID=1302730 RepID=A0A521DVG8_9BACT|nr:RsmE family RNA methyltransferase [Gracilimonas mengyeensis]SMO75676.1 16S rRNA (uracil1498-N3)-methyltransferase [Gracilimonas mengyeensis]
MNVFYVEPKRVAGPQFELSGQEARHAIKVLRLREGDEIFATDGQGTRYTGTVQSTGKDSVVAHITQKEEKPAPDPELVLAMGIIKKRDRLEFAVEKAVELGASKIVLFNSDHTVKTNVRMDRVENIIQSAMKQSMRYWLPEVQLLDSVDEVLDEFENYTVLMAHEKVDAEHQTFDTEQDILKGQKFLLLVGPEGGFSDREVELAENKGAELVSLGEYRLRAETAAVAFLARF